MSEGTSETASLERLSAARFEPCLADGANDFAVAVQDDDGGEARVALRLESVDVLAGDTPRPDAQPFSLLFRSLDGDILPQAIYRLENDTVGALDLFLVCLGPDPKGEGSLYEAIFT